MNEQHEFKKYGRDPLARERCTLKRNYGLTVEEKERVEDFQGHKCAICGRPLDRPNVDHSHATGEARGLLCWHCNNALGKFRDNPEILLKAAEFLKNPPVEQALGGKRFGLPGRISTSMKRRRTLAVKNVLEGRVAVEAYAFCCPELKGLVYGSKQSRKRRLTNDLAGSDSKNIVKC